MNNALKGALLSGLVFPGLGQVVLGKYVRGAVIIIISLASFSIILVKAVKYTLAFLERIQTESGAGISDAAAWAYSASGWLTFNIALVLIIFCWIIATIDAYKIGRQKDIGILMERP